MRSSQAWGERRGTGAVDWEWRSHKGNLGGDTSNNKELFQECTPYMDNLTLSKRVPFIYHMKGLPGEVKILHPVRKNTLFS